MDQSQKPIQKPKQKSHYITRCEASLNLAQCQNLHPDFRLVMAYLISTDNNKTRVSYHTQQEIAEILQIGRRTVIRAIQAAAAISILEIVAETKKQARNLGIPIKGYGSRFFYTMHYGHEALIYDDATKRVRVSDLDALIVTAHMRGYLDDSCLREAFLRVYASADPAPRSSAGSAPRSSAGSAPRSSAGSAPTTKPRLKTGKLNPASPDNWNPKESLKASLSQQGEPAEPAEKEKAKALVTEQGHLSSSIDSRPDLSTEVKQLTDTVNLDSVGSEIQSNAQTCIQYPEEEPDPEDPAMQIIDEDNFYKFVAKFRRFNPLRRSEEFITGTFIKHWNEDDKFRAKYDTVVDRLNHSRGVRKSFKGPGSLNPNWLFHVKRTSDGECSAKVWQLLVAKLDYYPFSDNPLPPISIDPDTTVPVAPATPAPAPVYDESYTDADFRAMAAQNRMLREYKDTHPVQYPALFTKQEKPDGKAK